MVATFKSCNQDFIVLIKIAPIHMVLTFKSQNDYTCVRFRYHPNTGAGSSTQTRHIRSYDHKLQFDTDINSNIHTATRLQQHPNTYGCGLFDTYQLQPYIRDRRIAKLKSNIYDRMIVDSNLTLTSSQIFI